MIRTSIFVPVVGTTLMAAGTWLDFTGENPVLKAVYICVVIAVGIMGLVQTAQLDE